MVAVIAASLFILPVSAARKPVRENCNDAMVNFYKKLAKTGETEKVTMEIEGVDVTAYERSSGFYKHPEIERMIRVWVPVGPTGLGGLSLDPENAFGCREARIEAEQTVNGMTVKVGLLRNTVVRYPVEARDESGNYCIAYINPLTYAGASSNLDSWTYTGDPSKEAAMKAAMRQAVPGLLNIIAWEIKDPRGGFSAAYSLRVDWKFKVYTPAP